MKKVSHWLVVAALLFLLAPCVFALDLTSAGFTVVSQKTEAGAVTYDVKDSAGHEFSVVGGTSFTQAQLNTITELKNDFYSWKNMTVAVLRIVMNQKPTQILVVPAKYSYGSVDITPYMPSGMQFFYTTYLEYDFRLKVENIFVRVTGQYYDEDQFSARLVTAIKDPAAFIASTDPAYLLRRIEAVESSVQDLTKQLTTKDDEIQKSLSETQSNLAATSSDYEKYKAEGLAFYADYQQLKKAFETLDTNFNDLKAAGYQVADDFYAVKADHEKLRAEFEQLTAKHDALQKSFDELSQRHDALQKSYDELSQNHDSLVAQVKELTDEVSILRSAFLTQNNTAFLKGPSPIEQSLIDKVLALKKATPDMTARDIVKALRDQKIRTTEKIVKLILLAYLGEFE